MTLTGPLVELIANAFEEAGLEQADIPTLLDEPTVVTAILIAAGTRMKNRVVNRDPDPEDRPIMARRRLSMLPAPANR